MSLADPTRLKVTKDFNVSGIALSVARVPGTDRLYYGNSDFKLYEVDALADKPQPVAFEGEGHQSYVTGVALAGTTVVSGGYDGKLIWWDRESKKPVRTVDAHERWIRRIAISPDGKVLASVADDMLGKIWDASTGQLLFTLEDHKAMTPNDFPSMLFAVAFSPDGRWLATGDKVGHVAIWDTSNGRKVSELEAPGFYTWDPRQRRHSIGGIRSLAFSADSKLIAMGGVGKIGNIDHLDGNSRVEIFDWQKKERLFELEDSKYKGLVETLAFDREGRWIVASGGDHSGFVTFFSLESGKLLHQEKVNSHVHQFVLNEEQNRLFAVAHGRIAVLDFAAEEPAGADAPPLPEPRA